jgi:hypothetical protein
VKLRAKKRKLQLKIDAPTMKVKKYKTNLLSTIMEKEVDMEE